MADMAVFIVDARANTVGVHLDCKTMASTMVEGDAVTFATVIGWNKTQAKANAQIQDDAVAALLAERGIVVGPNDNKILIAGPGGW